MLKVAKLVTGEFVIGKYTDNYLSNVMLIHFNVNHKLGTVGKTLLPYMAPISNSIGKIITNDKIMCVEDAANELQMQYISTLQEWVDTIKGLQQNDKNNNGQNAISGTDQTTTETDSK